MRNTTTRFPQCVRWTALLLCFFLCATLAPAEPKEKRTPPEPLAKEINRIRNAIINASSKLNNDVVGISAGVDGVPPNPARSCCSSNLSRIEKSSAELVRLLEEFDRCFERELDQAMLLTTRMAKTDLDNFDKAVSVFADSMVKAEARQGITLITRAFTRLDQMLTELRPCTSIDLARPDNEAKEK